MTDDLELIEPMSGLFDTYSVAVATLLAQAIDANAPPAAGDPAAFSGKVSVLTSYEFWLTVAVLVFGVFVMIVGCRFIASRRGNTPDQIIKLISVNLIVIGTLVIITGGFNGEQIAPAFGLFGTIAGYLLGRSDRPNTFEGKAGDQSNSEKTG